MDMYILLLFPVFVSALFGVLLLSYGFRKNKPKGVLGIVMLNGFLISLALYFYFSGAMNIYIYWGPFFAGIILCFFPILLRYVEVLAKSKSKKYYVHFIPAILLFIIGLPFWITLTTNEAVFFVTHYLEGVEQDNFSMGILFIISRAARIVVLVQIIVYTILIMRQLKSHNYRVGNYFSALKGRELIWIKYLSLPFSLFVLSTVCFALLKNDEYFSSSRFIYFSYLLNTIFFFSIGWFGIRQESIWESNSKSDDEDKGWELVTNVMTKEKLEKYYSRERPYLSPDFKITDACRDLGVNRTYLSRFINETYKMNFCYFTNTYRVNEAQKLLRDVENNKFTLMKIGEDCGFSSIQSFNRVFKKLSSVSPSRYREQ
ncbi:MAG: helix-turn-helix domain-containing protein [Draconibacterium sp.]